jgi:multiple sugar transport system permease protein
VPIVSVIERKTLKGRAFVTLLYLILGLGGITMVYPFLLMLRLSTADNTDNNTLNVVPGFWTNQDELAKKYVLKRYYGLAQNPYCPEVTPNFGPMPEWGAEWTVANFAELPHFWSTYYEPFSKIPEIDQRKQLSDYLAFLGQLPLQTYIAVDWDPDPSFLSFSGFLEQRLHLSKVERSLLYFVRPDASIRDWHPYLDRAYARTRLYLDWIKPQFRRPLYPPWISFLKAKYGQFDVSKLNKAYGSSYGSWSEVRFPLEEPSAALPKTDYREFVAKDFPHIWIRVRGEHQDAWRQFLIDDQKIRTPADWRLLTGATVSSIESIPFTATIPENEGWALMWSRFVHANIGVEDRELRSPDRLYAEFLRRRYSSLNKLNAAWGTSYKSWDSITFAESLLDYRTMLDRTGDIKVALTTQPFAVAFAVLGTQGTAIANTAILMFLALVAALTVNPLAAYSLSRFRIRGSHKILLFILATMALPAEIAMVPSFLLVKNLGLMNNYLALVLPGAASAFGIFLLKGFFDSLPSELYEAATLDGAKELTIFARITIPLAKPILAVTALGAVLGAYGTFISAILYLPNQDLWPIMPQLFSMSTQHNIEITYGVNMAALVIGSIPTFLVFLFAQRQIMRGIILPTFK